MKNASNCSAKFIEGLGLTAEGIEVSPEPIFDTEGIEGLGSNCGAELLPDGYIDTFVFGYVFSPFNDPSINQNENIDISILSVARNRYFSELSIVINLTKKVLGKDRVYEANQDA